MSIEEAKILIQSLVETDRCEPLRKKVLAIAYDVGIIWGDTIEDKQMNMVKINQFLINRGTIKKQLHKLSYEELIKTVKQFESIRRNNAYSEAGKQVKNLLTELNITTL